VIKDKCQSVLVNRCGNIRGVWSIRDASGTLAQEDYPTAKRIRLRDRVKMPVAGGVISQRQESPHFSEGVRERLTLGRTDTFMVTFNIPLRKGPRSFEIS
jgi:hypothetical protein